MEQELVTGWTRPESVPCPSVWNRFEGRSKLNGIVPKFWIQDLPEHHFEVALNHMVNGFLVEQPCCQSLDLISEMASVEDFANKWREIMRKKAALACYMENEYPNEKPVMVAISMTYVLQKDEPDSMQLTGSKARRILEAFAYASKKKDMFRELGTDSYLYSMGMYVLPKFRGQNIGSELLKSRKIFCRAMDIKASVAFFTPTASQILATRAGFKVMSEISFKNLEENNSNLFFPGIEKHTKLIKYMYIKYE